MIRTLILIGAVSIFTSCDDSVFFEEYKSFKNQNWNADSAVFFNYAITDTTSENTITIKFRHTVEYEFQNLFLFIETEAIDTVELMLADKQGIWLGSGIGDIREFKFEYQNAKLFSRKGNYSFKIEQAMRYGVAEKIQILNNTVSLGLSIEKQNE